MGGWVDGLNDSLDRACTYAHSGEPENTVRCSLEQVTQNRDRAQSHDETDYGRIASTSAVDEGDDPVYPRNLRSGLAQPRNGARHGLPLGDQVVSHSIGRLGRFVQNATRVIQPPSRGKKVRFIVLLTLPVRPVEEGIIKSGREKSFSECGG